jgi:hypothetical protein
MHLHRAGDFARAARISGADGAENFLPNRAVDGDGTGSGLGLRGVGGTGSGPVGGGEHRGDQRVGQRGFNPGLRRIETNESEICMDDRHHGTRLQFGAGGGYWG